MNIPPAQASFGNVAGASLLSLGLRGAMISTALTLLVVTGALLAWDALLPTPHFFFITSYFFHHGDVFWLVIVAGLLLAFAFIPAPIPVLEDVIERAPRRPVAVTLGLALFVFLCGALGARYVFHNVTWSRDELLADFDAIIFQSGLSMAPVADAWRRYAPALVSQPFMQPVADHAAFISAYLPGNALLRALTGLLLGERNLTSPLLAAISVLACYGVARRLWPEQRDAALVSAILVATSTQVLVTAMTPFAMTAHLAFNLVWLWLFLRDDRIGHCGAIAVGAFACGLHQLVFHPLFAAPFVFSLWRTRRRRLACAYAASYALSGLFWISYWKLALAFQGLAQQSALPAPSGVGGLEFFLMRLLVIFVDYEWQRLPLMLKNLARFVAWENPLLLPLALLSWRAADGQRAMVRDLWAGVGLTLFAMLVILPYQGHGWGYRYLHGLIGSLSLLAGFGWITLTAHAQATELASARAALASASAFACLVLLPARAKEAQDVVAPYARSGEAIRRANTDIVILDRAGLRSGVDLLINDPFLRNRPIIMDLDQLKEEDIDDLCRRFTVSLFDAANGAAYGVPLNQDDLKLKTMPRRPSCARHLPTNLGQE
jgi:hypothetical protein